jgi:hypothetical protein
MTPDPFDDFYKIFAATDPMDPLNIMTGGFDDPFLAPLKEKRDEKARDDAFIRDLENGTGKLEL